MSLTWINLLKETLREGWLTIDHLLESVGCVCGFAEPVLRREDWVFVECCGVGRVRCVLRLFGCFRCV